MTKYLVESEARLGVLVSFDSYSEAVAYAKVLCAKEGRRQRVYEQVTLRDTPRKIARVELTPWVFGVARDE